MQGRLIRLSVFLALWLAALDASHAANSSTPAPPTPGQVQSTLPTAPPTPEVKAAPLVQTPAPLAGEVASGGPTVMVTGFDITGNTVFSTALLQQQIASYVGKDLTLAGLYAAADELTKFYQSHGYGIARVTLPQQKLTGGHVTLQVIEGVLGKVSVEDNTRTRTGVILKQGRAVQSGDVYTDAAMDRASLLVNDLPGLQAQAVLQPGSVFGTTDLVYKVTENKEYSGQISVDDYGRPDVGRWRLNGEVDLASLTGSGDKLTADVTHTEDNQLNFGALAYSLPLGPDGGRLNASYNQSRYHVTGEFSALNLNGTSKNGSLSYQDALVRSHDISFFLGLGFQHEGSGTTLHLLDTVTHKPSPTVTVSSNQLNLMQLTGFYVRSLTDGSTYNLSGSFSSNGHHDDGNDPTGELAKLEVDGNYQHPFAGVWSLVTKGSAVWSPDPLPDVEKFSLGGPDSVRGFPSADVRGDAGLFASLELQRSFASSLPIAVGGFLDSGRAWSRHFDTPATFVNPYTHAKIPGFVTTPPTVETLYSVGAELIFQSPDQRWNGRIAWAFPVGYARPSDGVRGGHIWATLGMNF